MRNTLSPALSFLTVVSFLAGLFPPDALASACPVSVERISTHKVDFWKGSASSDSSPSEDGRHILFHSYVFSDDAFEEGIFLKDRTTNLIADVGGACASGDFSPRDGSLSANGRKVTYLTAGCEPTGIRRAVVVDAASGDLLFSSPESVIEPPSLSRDGRLLLYSTESGRLLLRDLLTGEVQSIPTSPESDGGLNYPWLSPSGRFAIVVNDIDDTENGLIPAPILHDLTAGSSEVLSINDGGNAVPSYEASISEDGRYAVFRPYLSAKIFLRDRRTGTTSHLAGSDQDDVTGNIRQLNAHPIISSSGRYIAYVLETYRDMGSEFKLESRDVAVHDQATHRTAHVNTLLQDGSEPKPYTDEPRFSGDERYLSFTSYAASFTADDRNGEADVFFVPMALLFGESDECPAPPSSYTPDPDGDPDKDGVKTSDDNCPYRFNPGQQDRDGDGKGDFCDLDGATASRSEGASGGCSLTIAVFP